MHGYLEKNIGSVNLGYAEEGAFRDEVCFPVRVVCTCILGRVTESLLKLERL
jgi:hypothetical protein